MLASRDLGRPAWALLFVAFAGLNVWAIGVAGLDGLATYLGSLGPIGILATVDLLLSLFVGLVFVARESRRLAVDVRPWVLLTLLTGSLGLLGYLARHDAER